MNSFDDQDQHPVEEPYPVTPPKEPTPGSPHSWYTQDHDPEWHYSSFTTD